MHSFPVLLIVALVVAGLIYRWRRNLALRDSLANLARANAWAFMPRDDALARTWTRNPFGEGSSRQCRNIVQGTSDGWPFLSLDYQYTTRSGDNNSQTHSYAATAVQLPVAVPPLGVTPTNVLTRLFGGNDVQLESEDFNRRFRVETDTPKLAYDVLPARTMEMLLGRSPVPWHFEGPWLVCYSPGDLAPAVLLNQLDLAKQVLAGIPPFVWKDLGAAPPPQ